MIHSAELATVTVTYHPDPHILRIQLCALPENSFKLLIDNASSEEAIREMQALAATIPNIHLVTNSTNIGLAAALNQGVRLVKQLHPTAKWCLLLDQDSEPDENSVNALLAGMEQLMQQGEKVGSVGPKLIDITTGLSHGFHQPTRWLWRRIHPGEEATKPVPCSNLNGSGTLVSLQLFEEMSGLDESLFIDHVDTEWAFRLLAHGYTLWGIPQAVFRHRMGQNSLRYWLFGWHVWPHRSSLRHYYLFRNALWLMKRPYVPFVWKFWASIKLALTLTVHMLFDTSRRTQLQAMIRGLREGFKPQKAKAAQP
jgi:rhamnosyltransferase